MRENRQSKPKKVLNAFSKINIMLFSMLFLFTGTAMAADIDAAMFTPAENDWSLAILSQLFGELVIAAGGGNYAYNGNLFLGERLDPFQDILTSFNVMCAIVAITLGGTSLAQKLNEMSEKGQTGDFGSALYWVRVGVGATFIMPVHYGYCVLQVMVMWLIINSVGAADHILKMWLGITTTPENVSIGSGTSNMDAMYKIKMPAPQIADLIYKTAEGYTCAYGLASQKVADNFQQLYEQKRFESLKSVKNGAYTNSVIGVTTARQENPLIQEKKLTSVNVDSETIGVLNNSNKDSTVVLQETIAKSQSENQRLQAEKNERFNATRTAEQQAFSQAKQEALSKMDTFVSDIFGNNVNLISLQAEHTKPFYFGVQGKKESLKNAEGAKVRNKEISAVCGFIDFTKTVNSNAAKELVQNAAQAIKHLEETKKIEKEQAAQARQGLTIGSSNQEALLKNKPKYDAEMVAAYVAAYNVARQQIAEATRDYVAKINNEVRFVATEDGSWLQAPLSNAKYTSIQLEALDEYNAKLYAIARNMESNLLNAMISYFNKTSNKNLINDYMQFGFDALPRIMQESNLSTNFVDSRNLANAIAFRDGWFSFGSIPMLLTNSIHQVQTLGNYSPALGYASDRKEDYSSFIGDGEKAIVNVRYKTHAFNEIKAFYGLYPEIAERSTHPAIIRLQNPSSGPVNSIASLALGLDLSSLTMTDRHPLIVMIEAGYSLINASEKFLTFNSYWDARQGKVSKDNRPTDGNPANVSAQSNMLLTTAMSSMVVIGLMLAFYLPVLPFLIWVGATLGWLVAVVEAILVAPLWAAMHLSNDGSKLVGKGQTGYSLLLSLLFRAPLMVMGFIAAFTILQVYGIYLNYIFGFSVMLSLGGSFSTEEVTFMSLTSILAAYGIYAIYMQIVITKIFNITTVLADQALRWIGGPTGNLSEYANMAGQEMSGKIQGFAQPLGNAGLQRRVEAARTAGAEDQRAVGGYLNTLSSNQMSGEQREFNNATMVGSGWDRMFNNGQVSSGNHVSGLKVDMPAPSTPQEQAQHEQMYNNAMKVAETAGMTPDEQQQFAKKVADMGYKHNAFTNAMGIWGNNQVFGRGGDLAQNREALWSAVNNANNAEAANQAMTSYMRDAGLTSSRNVQSESYGSVMPTMPTSGVMQQAQQTQSAQTQAQSGSIQQANQQPQQTAQNQVVPQAQTTNAVTNSPAPEPVNTQVAQANTQPTAAVNNTIDTTPPAMNQQAVPQSIQTAQTATPQVQNVQQKAANVASVSPQATTVVNQGVSSGTIAANTNSVASTVTVPQQVTTASVEMPTASVAQSVNTVTAAPVQAQNVVHQAQVATPSVTNVAASPVQNTVSTATVQPQQTQVVAPSATTQQTVNAAPINVQQATPTQVTNNVVPNVASQSNMVVNNNQNSTNNKTV